MKKILTLLALICLFTAVTASAQVPTYAPQTLISYIGTATNCAGSAATNVAAVIDCRKQASVTIQAVTRNDGSGTDNIGFFFQRSVDGTSYEATGQLVTIAAKGASDAVLVTNLPSSGCGFIKLAYITNAAAATVNTTNIVVKYAVKISSP